MNWKLFFIILVVVEHVYRLVLNFVQYHDKVARLGLPLDNKRLKFRRHLF